MNTSIYANAAQNAYGGIYPFYNNEYEAALPHGFGSVSLLLCSYAGNTCDTQYDYTAEAFEWYQRPGDVWEIPYVNAYGCLIVDDTLDRDFAKYTTPVADNNYNYFASPRRAEADGLDVSVNAGGYGHYQPAAPENIAWSVPSDFAQGVLNGRYGGKTQKLHVGSNYSPALYPRADSADYTMIIIAGAVLLAAGIAALLILQGRRRIKERIQAEAEISVGAEPQAAGAATGEAAVDIPVFLNRFTYEQIDEVLAAMPEAARLTTREREVVREILSGKQQLEIAHELGIEVTTVKDFNRKIYDKFNVANKKKLLEKVGMLYHGQ